MQNNNYKGCDSEINKTVKSGTIVLKYHVLARNGGMSEITSKKSGKHIISAVPNPL